VNDAAAAPDRAAEGPLARYERWLAAGELTPDPAQRSVAERLQALHEALRSYDCAAYTARGLARLFRRKPAPPTGLYIHGGVGRGKSMLMDLFYEAAPTRPKRRAHFHEFMLDVHARLDRHRKADRAGERAGDPIPPVAREIAGEACLLCFDEFNVTDVADAMILGRLFDALWACGVVVVATSNRHPDDLYKDGLNRQLFIPFIEQLKRTLEVMPLDGPTDYRLERLRGMRTYLTPVNEETTQALREDFYRLTDRVVDDPDKVPSAEIDVGGGRSLYVPKACKGVAVFSFRRLCAQSLGAADYLAIARRFHTVIMVAIPQMGSHQRNEAKRFMTLVDVLYETNVKFLCSAEVPPEELYTEGDGGFEFQRTVSRLMEMQSQRYLEHGHGMEK